ncbi:MAG: LexA family transcriptional regulator [Fimbriimonadia bacterium]|nr:LexA family transcriptional regulator [Fimbriimonadia bacterium]
MPRKSFRVPKSDVAVALGRNIRQVREQLGWSQQEAADQLDITQTTLSAYERGRIECPVSVLSRLASLANLTAGAIVDGDFEGDWRDKPRQVSLSLDERNAITDNILQRLIPLLPAPLPGHGVGWQEINLPLWGSVPAGQWGWVPETSSPRRYLVPLSIAKAVDGVVTVQGESMLPTLEPGDTVFVKRTPHAHVGKIVLARNPLGDVTLKRIGIARGLRMLLPDNPAHEPPEPAAGTEILAVAVCVMREL